MTRRTRRNLAFAAGLAAIVALEALELPGLGPARLGAQQAASPEWFQVTVVRIKPDLLTEWLDFQRKETIPALQKGGSPGREAWQTATFGEGFEYTFVTPIRSFAQYDAGSPILKALGEQGFQAYGAKNRRFQVSTHTYAITSRPDLSNTVQQTGAPNLALVTFVSVLQGRNQDFEIAFKADVLAAFRREKAEYSVYQTVLGGDTNEYVTVTPLANFAALDKGLPAARVMGQANFTKFTQKIAGMVAHVERRVMRYNAELSFSAKPTSSAAK